MPEEVKFTPNDMERAAIKQWVSEGLSDAAIAKKFKVKKVRITEFLAEQGIKRVNQDKVNKAGFVNKTRNGHKGVAISTSSSSTKGDALKGIDLSKDNHTDGKIDAPKPNNSMDKYKGSIHKID